ncbi:MAG: GNAT family protein [Dehalococcoidia bacterium]
MPLTGTSVQLRAIERSDAAKFYAWINDHEVTEHLGIVYPLSLASEEQWAERAAKQNSYVDAQFAIEIAATGEHIGNCGIHKGSIEQRSCEVGILIGVKEQWGKGYGTDALRTLVTFAFRQLNMRRVMLFVDEDHPGGIKSYERAGFQVEGRERAAHWSRGRAVDFLAMSILREEFDARYGAHDEWVKEAVDATA